MRGTERVVPLRRPKGPKGFEDRTTFMVVDRDSFAGTPITKKGNKLSTATYDVEVTASAGGTPSIVVTSPAGAVLYNSSAEGGSSGTPVNCKGLSQQKCTQLICKPRMGIIWVRLKHIMLMGRSSLELNGFCQDCPLRVLSTQILSARTDCNYVRAAQRCARRGAHCVDDCLRALCFGTSKKVLKCICLAQRGMQVHTSARAPPRQP